MHQPNDHQIDPYDRQLGALHGLPDVVHTKPTTLRQVEPLTGSGSTWIVTTYRQSDEGDTVFLEVVTGRRAVRLVLPPSVTAAIARHRSALETKVRRRVGQRLAAERKERGIVPFAKTGA